MERQIKINIENLHPSGYWLCGTQIKDDRYGILYLPENRKIGQATGIGTHSVLPTAEPIIIKVLAKGQRVSDEIELGMHLVLDTNRDYDKTLDLIWVRDGMIGHFYNPWTWKEYDKRNKEQFKYLTDEDVVQGSIIYAYTE